MADGITIVLILVAGFFTGVLSGTFGVGGAVISTPAILALGATNLEAVGSTLPSVIPSSISGSLRYVRDGLVHRRVALVTGLAGATSAAVGAVASDAFPGRGHVQMILTAGLLGFTAYRTGLMASPVRAPAGGRPGRVQPRLSGPVHGGYQHGRHIRGEDHLA